MLRLLPWLPWVIPGAYLLGAVSAAAARSLAWPAVTASTRVALAVAILGCAIPRSGSAPIVATLIGFLGWIIGDYSRRYLRGEPGQTRFTIAFLATLAAVTTVVGSTNLAVTIGAWAASSVGLHHLLTFYRDRPAAIIAAHKKFLASRLADLLLVGAATLLYRQWRTLDISTITAKAHAAATLPGMAGIAAVLIAAAVLLKCAQLPLHGWLIQVMEAPTPVSALLHAGVVNLGGYVLIQLAPLIGASPPAQTLLVVVGSLTAAVAGLVTLTRITIKVRLAWSTCSQMGFMVMECGLALYDLALLHLLAHALYKAHAFLSAGETVRDGLARQLVAGSSRDASDRGANSPLLLWPVLALPTAWIVATGSGALWHGAFYLPRVPWIAIALLAFGLAPLLWSPTLRRAPNWKSVLALVAGVQIYLGWHWVLAERLGVAAGTPHVALAVWSLSVFLALYAAQVVVWKRQPGLSANPLYEWIYAGLYLDERFTRLSFRLWPPAAHHSGDLARPGSSA